MSSNDSSKLFRKRTWLDWLRFSGASVTVTVNPWHWQWIPQIQNEPLDRHLDRPQRAAILCVMADVDRPDLDRRWGVVMPKR